MLRIIPWDGCYVSVAFRQYPDVSIHLPHLSFECVDLLSLGRLRAFQIPGGDPECHVCFNILIPLKNSQIFTVARVSNLQ